mmetsp:Transcript_52825/g.171907  ORF Transcript_52825/g.171907 Transcript_52825/m.171907 type:complete len:200 (+) Transcript_52825:669-1268(+)
MQRRSSWSGARVAPCCEPSTRRPSVLCCPSCPWGPKDAPAAPRLLVMQRRPSGSGARPPVASCCEPSTCRPAVLCCSSCPRGPKCARAPPCLLLTQSRSSWNDARPPVALSCEQLKHRPSASCCSSCPCGPECAPVPCCEHWTSRHTDRQGRRRTAAWCWSPDPRSVLAEEVQKGTLPAMRRGGALEDEIRRAPRTARI